MAESSGRLVTGPVPSPVVHALFRSLDLPPLVAGQLDWVAGIYRINRTAEEWRAWFVNPGDDPELTVTLVHEMHHFMQISSLSYLHRFATLLYYSVAQVVKTSYTDLSALPATLPDNEDVRTALWDLQWRDPDGLSVLDIVESLTYFVEVNTEKPVKTSAYAAHLDEADDLPEEYKRGFRLAFDLSGKHGDLAAMFEFICHLSLCSGDPRTCFAMLAEAVRSGEIHAEMSYDQVETYCQQHDPDHWGFAWDWRQSVRTDFPRHPVFGSLEPALADETMYVNFLKYMLSPHKFFDPFLKLAQAPPILFNPYPAGAAAGYDEWPLDVGLALRDATPEEKRKAGTWSLYMASASRKYLDAIGTPPSAVRRVRIEP